MSEVENELRNAAISVENNSEAMRQRADDALSGMESRMDRAERRTEASLSYLDLIAEILSNLLYIQHRQFGLEASSKLEKLRESVQLRGVR